MNLLTPHQTISKTVSRALIAAWAIGSLVWWGVLHPAVIPSPLEVCDAWLELWSAQGLPQELFSSLCLNIEAIILGCIISLLLAYASRLALFKPFVLLSTKFRFLGLTGLTFIFGLYLQGHQLKVGLLTFGMVVFLATSLVNVVMSVPKEKLDHARTLGMGEWRVLWEVIVLGTAAEALEVIRQNAAMSLMMLTMVEGLVRSDGGLGALLLNENKHFKLASVFALQITILAIGLLQDYAIVWIRKLVCPYADLKIQKQ